VYATAVSQNVCERENAKYCREGPLDQFQVSVVINGESVTAIRDTACQLNLIVNPRFVRDGDYTGQYVSCRGAFDSRDTQHYVPLAEVAFCAPALKCPYPERLTAAVLDIQGADCLIGNALFVENHI